MSRRSRLVLLTLALLLVVGALWAAVAWWFALPEGEIARYVGRRKCAECHEPETQLWTASDHDLAMDHATPATVLGNFNDQPFHHIAFDQLGRLSDGDLRTLLESIPVEQLTLAMHGADAELEDRISAGLPGAGADRLRQERETLHERVVRPCDVTSAQRQIGDVARRLEREGKITVNFGVRSKFFRQGDDFFVTTDNRQGQMETFQVKYVFGVRPLQQYLVELPKGRVQCLPLAWDTERDQWYHLYPGEPIPHNDLLHWTRPLQNWNYMCAECHTTDLKKNYDLASDSYHTTWSEIDVSCETCHGPGSLHVRLSESSGPFWDRRYGYGLPNLKSEDSRVEIETCAPCHSRRRIVHPNARPGEPFLDYYAPELLDRELYYADGQILDEDYVYGSFLQSLMYRKGVRCSDCHDPHSARVKFDDNRLCGQCHVPSTYDTPQHHHHPDASKPGTLCVECHMPETTYMVVDPRRDHSLRVPRPDLTVPLAIPNACNGCHNDQTKGETAQWAEDTCREWYGEGKGPPQRHFAYAIDAGRKGLPEGERELFALVRRKDVSAMVRASAIALLGRSQSGGAQAAAIAGLEDPDGLVRAASVRCLSSRSDLPGEELLRLLAPMLHDPLRAVRTEAASALAPLFREASSQWNRKAFDPDLGPFSRQALSQEERKAFDSALAEYFEGQRAVNDQPGAHLNMGVVYSDLQKDQKAVDEYQAALRIDPDFIPAMINLAMLYDRLGKSDEAKEQFLRVIELEPEMADAHYYLGLLLAQDDQRLPEAAGYLAAAAERSPENRRIHYNYGLALQKLGRIDEAEKELITGLKLAAHQPDAVDFLNALTILYTQTRQFGKATAGVRDLMRLQPDNPQWRRLLEHIEREKAEDASPKTEE